MIKIGNRDITLKLGSTNVSAAYLGSVQVYGGSPSYDLCYGVTDDISTYTGTFKDVFDKSSETWYKRNNLNEYEEYGIYGSGRTSCEGSTSRLPQGYTEVEYIENTSTAYINTEVLLYDSTTNSYEIETKMSSTWGGGEFEYLLATEGTSSPYNGFELRWNIHYQSGGELQCESVPNNVTYSNIDNGDGTSAITISCTSTNVTNNVPLSLFCGIWSSSPWRNGKGKIYDLKITKNDVLVRDLVPCKRDSDVKYGMYDIVNDVFYISPNNVNLTGGDPITPTDCVTTYEGKLTIDDGYEYQYTNGAWVNVGEVSGGTTPLPDVPFTVNINAKQYDSTTKTFAKTQGQLADTDVTITTGTVTPHDDYVTVTGSTKGVISGYDNYFNRDSNNPNFTIISKHRTADNSNIHLFANRNSDYNWMYRPAASKLVFHGSSQINGVSVTTQPVIGSVRVDSSRNLIFNNYTDNTTTAFTNFSYGGTNSGGVALFAGYVGSGKEYFNGDFYWIYVSQNTLTDAQVQQVINYNEGGGSSEYPIYYDEKADPLDNLTFNTLAEAEAYAYANCVYDGMTATIAGEKYVFDSTNGWTIVPEYYKVEDVTPQGASGWTITGSSTYNPDSSYYDDFSVENATTSNVTKIAKVTIYGYENFTYYLRSYGYSIYAHVYATNVDELASDPTTNFGYYSSSAITNTYGWNINAGSNVDLGHYRRVTFNNLDKTVEHTFYVIFYGRARSTSQNANATILIPKEQTNENWEQVTFSASSNVASAKKNLYIDNNTSTSGGMENFYYRYVVGLPSGTHTSNTNYSDYNYCPNVTSSTFTSVAGEQRQVNFTYDDTTNKWLDCYLVDTSGNTLSNSDIVYYNMTYYNPCNASKSQILNIAHSVVRVLVKDGGSFVFGNSSNRHYIYGYQPPTLGTRYYVDNYTDNFNIVYTKLSEEAVTLSYVTYDPNDSETPSLKTDITYPYNGGTTSATTLTSFNVPYSYTYIPKAGNELFSADSQTYTAGQASRTITLTLYPNNREFSTVADMEAYQYAWEGMIAFVGDTRYKYENGEWTQTIWIKASETILSVSGTTTLQITEWVANMKYPRKIKMNKNTSGSGSYCWAYFKKLNTDPDPFLSIPSSTENYINYNGRQYSPPTILSWITEEDGYWIFDLEESGDYGYLFLNKYQTNFLLNNLEFMF